MLFAFPPLLVTLDEAAAATRQSADTISNWHDPGQPDRPAPDGFPPPVARRPLRWRWADLERYVATLPPLPSGIPPLPAAAPAAATAAPVAADEPIAARRGRGRPRKVGGLR